MTTITPDRLIRDYSRKVCSPVDLSGASAEAPKVICWIERAKAYYLGYEEFADIARWGLGRIDQPEFRGVPVFRVLADNHYEVVYER